MEVPNYGPFYGPVTNGLGTGLLGTAAATAITTAPTPCNYSNIPSQSYTYSNSISTQWWPTPSNKPLNEVLDEYQKDIETLKEENEALKNKLDLLEIQFKFLLNKFTELEGFMESRKGS